MANKYQKHIACSYSYKLVCVDDKSSKPITFNFINSTIEESKYCRDPMKKYFNKETVMTKGDNESIKNTTKCWVCDDVYIDNYVKVRDHCHITGNTTYTTVLILPDKNMLLFLVTNV